MIKVKCVKCGTVVAWSIRYRLSQAKCSEKGCDGQMAAATEEDDKKLSKAARSRTLEILKNT